MSVLKYRDPVTGSWIPILNGSIPSGGGGGDVESEVVAGLGLSGGGSTIPSATLNVGVSPQFAITDDGIDLQAVSPAITDWNDAITNGWYRGNSAANAPPNAPGWWHGIVAAYSSTWVVQMVWPMAQTNIDPAHMMVRRKINGTWDAWYRQSGYVYTFRGEDNFLLYKHGGNSSVAGSIPGVTRFAAGVSTASTTPNLGDTYRLQCYDNAGNFSFVGMSMPESGVVSFPKGHSLLREAMAAEEEVPSDQAATVGVVAEMIVTALSRLGLLREDVDPATITGLLLGEPST